MQLHLHTGSSSIYQNDYLRVYSGGYTYSSGVLNDNQWYYAQGDGNENSGGNAGQWGLALAKMIKDQLNIPIAIFNGAHGGQPISFFDRPNDYNYSTATNYGRMYHRLEKVDCEIMLELYYGLKARQIPFPMVFQRNNTKAHLKL